MSILKKVSILAGSVLILLVNTGCVTSYLSARASQREIATKRIMASQDKNAVDALKMGVEPEVAIKAIRMENGAGISIDLFSLDTLTENPVRQIGAAVLDAALIYGGYRLVQNMTQSGNDNKNEVNTSTTTVNVNNADHTSVTIDNSSTTTSTDSHSTTSTDSHSGNGNNR